VPVDPVLSSYTCSTVKCSATAIFHKLTNLDDNLTYKNLALNPDLSRREARKQAKEARSWAVLREATYSYSGRDTEAIRQRVTNFQRKWAP
jgi:hypothetical protein